MQNLPRNAWFPVPPVRREAVADAQAPEVAGVRPETAIALGHPTNAVVTFAKKRRRRVRLTPPFP